MSVSPILYLVAAGHFINDIYMGFLAPLYPLIMERFHLTLPMVGTISMVAALASAFSQPVFGLIFDRYGASVMLYLAPLATGVFVSLIGVTPSYPLFLLTLFVGCLGSAAFHPTGASVTPSLSGSHPEIGMAIFSAGGNIGFAAGPALIALFIAAFGFGSSPLLMAPAIVVAAGLFLLLPVGKLRERTRTVGRITWRGLFADRGKSRVIVKLVFINFCINVGSRGVQTFLPVYLSTGGFSLTSIGLLFTVMLALGAAFSIYASILSRRMGKKTLILLSSAAAAPVFLVGLLLFPSFTANALVVLSGILLTFSNPLLILFAQKYSGNSPAMASSLLMGLSWGLAGLAMVPMGSLGEVMGVRNMLILAGVFPILAVPSCLRLPRE